MKLTRMAASRVLGALCTAVLASILALAGASDARAATEGFDPGYIISDDSFYDANALTAGQVQRFLEKQPCAPRDDSPCLADYRETTTTQPTEFAHCDRYQGRRDVRAADILWNVAQACGISPKVLIVLLQKEQSLLTRPSASGYQRATGYACPDTAECDERYFGFFNQLYNAAWQFREYGDSTGWRYHVGLVRVPFNPDASCGSAPVRIRNQATANLYNYTPYQPTKRTVADPQRGERCSTFGNLNFSRIFARWFGSPLTERLPRWWGDCLAHVAGEECVPPRVPPW